MIGQERLGLKTLAKRFEDGAGWWKLEAKANIAALCSIRTKIYIICILGGRFWHDQIIKDSEEIDH